MAHDEYETFEHAFLRNLDEPGEDYPNLFSYFRDYESLAIALCRVLSNHDLDFRKVFYKIEINAYDYGESVMPSILYKHMIAIPGCDPASKSHFDDLEPIDRQIYDTFIAKDEGDYDDFYKSPDKEDDEDEIFVKPGRDY